MTRRARLIAVAVAVLVIIGTLAYQRFVVRGALPEGLIQANGRIEGDTVALAGKYPGRIERILVQEGDAVKGGEVVAELDDAQVSAQVEQARQAAAALEAELAAGRQALRVLQREVPLAVAGAQAGLAQARAALSKARAQEEQAQREAERAQDLLAQGFLNAQGAEQANLTHTAASQDRAAAQNAVIRAEKQLADAQLGTERIATSEAELRAIEAQLARARAALQEAESVRTDLTLRAPSAGIVTSRLREPGEVVAAGAPVLEITDLDRLYLKVYVPEVQIGRLRLNLSARVHTDAFPAEAFPATVRHIASRAEFTPKEVQTPDERVKLTYAVKLYLDANPEHRLTPGLPADAVIRWREDVPWASPRW
jgi:HlyD family secretion protein